MDQPKYHHIIICLGNEIFSAQLIRWKIQDSSVIFVDDMDVRSAKDQEVLVHDMYVEGDYIGLVGQNQSNEKIFLIECNMKVSHGMYINISVKSMHHLSNSTGRHSLFAVYQCRRYFWYTLVFLSLTKFVYTFDQLEVIGR